MKTNDNYVDSFAYAPLGRSIPIVSREDYLNPRWHAPFACGEGHGAWNTIAGSPFAIEVSVRDWEELPALLNRLSEAPQEYLDKLQVRIFS